MVQQKASLMTGQIRELKVRNPLLKPSQTGTNAQDPISWKRLVEN
jgi:hypothetical protein